MTTTTANLGLFKYDTTTDSEVPFNINNALNGNWDIIDTALANPIPTKTSQLENDSGFLTSHQSLSAYATKASPTFTGTVSVPASTTAGTALQLAAQSKGSNGYVKFGSGIIIQWGRSAKITGADKTVTVTLPTSFSSASSYKIVTEWYTEDNIDDNPVVKAQTASNCTIWATSKGSNDGTWTAYANYVAVGY